MTTRDVFSVPVPQAARQMHVTEERVLNWQRQGRIGTRPDGGVPVQDILKMEFSPGGWETLHIPALLKAIETVKGPGREDLEYDVNRLAEEIYSVSRSDLAKKSETDMPSWTYELLYSVHVERARALLDHATDLLTDEQVSRLLIVVATYDA